jgi:hypothetical protein
MALAGFVKHNIIAMPMTAFFWLTLNQRREAVKCLCVALIAIAAGTAICYAAFGRDFFEHLIAQAVFGKKSSSRF